VWDKALAYGRQAGERAMARSAYREAVRSFDQALSDYGRSLANLSEAEALAEAHDDPHQLAQVSCFL
jgi:hypothetical protein